MHTTLTLCDAHVVEVFKKCLLQPTEAGQKYVFVVGIGMFNSTRFHAGRLEAHRQEIIDMLAELPTEFQNCIGNDMRKAVYIKYGWRWTTSLDSVNKLIQLGDAIDQVQRYPVRRFWHRKSDALTYFYVKQYTF